VIRYGKRMSFWSATDDVLRALNTNREHRSLGTQKPAQQTLAADAPYAARR
jgi:hypothetical protein